MASFLLSLGAHPDIQNKRGCTAVMLAAELGNYAIVALLSQSNANLKIQDNEGKGKQKHWVDEYYLAFFIGYNFTIG